MITVLLVDDHDLVRTGIRRLLDDIKGLEVIGEVETGEEAIEFVKNEKVDVVLMDLNMPGIGGMEATRRLMSRYKTLKVIVVTVHDTEPFPQQLFKAGAKGYLTKGCKIDEITHAIKEVFYGRRYISVDIAQKIAMSLQSSDENPFDSLSQREMQVLLMLMQGLKGQDISEQLNLSPKTVSTYRYRLLDKLKVKTDVELTRLAMQYGFIDDNL
ncbi:MAG: UvrY/SirA/GacA family response regulator transcription factor [gamma proteobacterium symbiont of Taylorina sp.]|nr:UvrY/SirA/GacA family response regulator transcription factor [gamma proteobacterium symbiont of Taylorina sp.]